MKTIYCLIIFLCPLISRCQNIKPLSIGDKAPTIVIHNLLNYSADSASLSDFKADLLILDFWATWCTPCVKSIPEFEQLQNQFGGKLQFVLVAAQEKDKIEKYLQAKNFKLPCFVENNILSKYFPHNSVPHEVWIKNGKVAAITYSNTVTAENIQKVLNEQPAALPEKVFKSSYDMYKPLLAPGNGGSNEDIDFQSLFTRYIPGIGRLGQVTDDQGRLKYVALDVSPAGMYVWATTRKYGEIYWLKNRLLITATQKDKINPSKQPGYAPEVRPYFFCYELIVPASQKKDAPIIMMDDLNRFFGSLYRIHGDVEKVKTKCWVLRRKRNIPDITSKKGPSKMENKDGYSLWQNEPFAKFFYSLSYITQHQPYPLIDKTGIKGNVDISLPASVNDIASLKHYLEKYNFTLTLEESEVSMIVIKNIP